MALKEVRTSCLVTYVVTNSLAAQVIAFVTKKL